MSASELDSTDRSDSPTETTLTDVSRQHDADGFDGQLPDASGEETDVLAALDRRPERST